MKALHRYAEASKSNAVVYFAVVVARNRFSNASFGLYTKHNEPLPYKASLVLNC